MKILIVNWEYNWGSTGHIVHDLYEELVLAGHMPIIAVGVNKDTKKSKIYQFSNNLERFLFETLRRFGWKEFAGGWLSTWRLIHHIKKVQPDIVHIHLLNFNVCDMYYVLSWLGRNQIKTVITHHAELLYTGTCGYAFDCFQWETNQCQNCQDEIYKYSNTHRNYLTLQKSMLSFAPKNIIHIAVSPWIKERLQLSPVTCNYPIEVIKNGVDTTCFKYSVSSAKQQYILHVSSCFDPIDKMNVKGGYYLVEIAKRMPEKLFYIAASYSTNCEHLPANVKLLGEIKESAELSFLYSNAAVTLLTSRRESFSMIVAESLCCGTPVVGFEAGGPESIAITDYCSFVPRGDVEQLKVALYAMLNHRFDKNEISQKGQKQYSKYRMTQDYIKIYNKLLEN
jgi:glycosyltransferase involved in cell wall biosynthesis